MAPEAVEVLDFWFGVGTSEADRPRSRWWTVDAAFDAEIARRFGSLHAQASSRALENWRAHAESALALVLLLDQFTRNLRRGSPAAYANDPYAREVAREAVAKGFDHILPPVRAQFFYLPFMHSEALADQDLCVELFEALTQLPDQANSLEFARRHREIVARFGRFPHRNSVLGRSTTPEETRFLAEPNSSF